MSNQEGVEIANLEALAQGEVAGAPTETGEKYVLLQTAGKIKTIGAFDDHHKNRAFKSSYPIIGSIDKE